MVWGGESSHHCATPAASFIPSLTYCLRIPSVDACCLGSSAQRTFFFSTLEADDKNLDTILTIQETLYENHNVHAIIAVAHVPSSPGKQQTGWQCTLYKIQGNRRLPFILFLHVVTVPITVGLAIVKFRGCCVWAILFWRRFDSLPLWVVTLLIIALHSKANRNLALTQ